MLWLKKLHEMSLTKKLSKEFTDDQTISSTDVLIGVGIAALYGMVAYLFLLPKRVKHAPGKLIDIEIRYNTEKDADTTFLAQNLVKILRIVLSPIESKITQEGAQLILVYGDDNWEMRVRNGSETLRQSVRNLLEAKEW